MMMMRFAIAGPTAQGKDSLMRPRMEAYPSLVLMSRSSMSPPSMRVSSSTMTVANFESMPNISNRRAYAEGSSFCMSSI